jgi:hypothetical protein
MIRGNAHRRAAVFVAAFHLALSFGLGINLVVCRSGNGHVAVESALEDCCPGYGLPERNQSLVPTSDCDGCTDTPLLQPVLQRNASSDREMVPAPELFSLGSLPSVRPGPSTVGVMLADGATIPTVALSTRRSIVLLV